MALSIERPLPPAKAGNRIWEIDFLRGVAILLMVAYHFGYDLVELAGVRTVLGIRVNLQSPPFQFLVSFFAGLFVALCGISGTLTRSNIRRGLKLLAVALLVTAASFVFNREETIFFGILHCLGVSLLLYGLILERAKPLTCLAAAGFIFGLTITVPLALKNVPIRFDWLLPFGVFSDTFSSFDYFPLLPWFGVFLVGAAAGKAFYSPRQSLLPPLSPVPLVNIAGRYSLWIYVIHQPVLLGLFTLLGLIK
ncbi:MAG: heparan-alpha-glucosaminide N-acetyltransferase [Candidatus Aminicenantes bacterium]|nr:heparan-alpha-glucosaminide N-acetyltransferase [Candidatus Aminicenantes bacterium]